MENRSSVNIPIILTLTRLIISPLVLPILLVYLLPFNILWINGVLAGLFVIFGLTDFFDGYFARRFKQETALGRVLDPIADKFLIYSNLIALVTIHKIYFYWAIILIGREIFMMGLRQIALEYSMNVHVSFLGKLKTASQIALITFLIINPCQQLGLQKAFAWNGTELALLVLTIGLSLLSAYIYYRSFMREFSQRDQGIN